MGVVCNVVDCVLWDLEVKFVGKFVWELVGLFKFDFEIMVYILLFDMLEVMEV